MRGHQPLIALRMDRKRPQGVWICHGRSDACLQWDKAVDTLPYPEIEILQTENPENLDLRFVVGLTVHVSGCKNYEVAKKLHRALLIAKARHVITVVGDLIIDSEIGENNDYVPE